MPPGSDVDAPSTHDPHPLDDVIWRALTGLQAHLGEGDTRARRYLAAVAPFAATIDGTPPSFASLLNLFGSAEDRVALVTPFEVRPPAEFAVIRREVVDQMVLIDKRARDQANDPALVALDATDIPEMLALTSVTQPGPFGARTIEFGAYLGIRRGGALVAMAGERLRLEGFTEISAVCVDAAHRGKGYAAELVTALIARILARSEIPFLHAFSSNLPAIALYRRLGFALRRQMHLAVLGRVSGH